VSFPQYLKGFASEALTDLGELAKPRRDDEN
jgi:hypothetical protein